MMFNAAEEKSRINWEPKGANGWSPLHLAAACGDMKGLVLLLDVIKELEGNGSLLSSGKKKHGKAVSRLELESASGDRALHVALRNGQVLVSRELARAGANIHATGKNKETVAHICAAQDLAEELTWLMKHYKVSPTALTERGETIIHIAVRECRISFLQWVTQQPFCTYGFFSTITRDGHSVVHSAAKTGVRVGVQWVLDYLNKQEKKLPDVEVLDLFLPDQSGKDPSAIARSEGHYLVATLLDDYRKNKTKVRKSRRSICKRLHEAIKRGTLQDVQFLVRKNQRHFNVLDMSHQKTGNTALMEAVAIGNVEIVKYILSQRGKRLLVNENTGETILHKAVQSKNVELIKYLVQRNLIGTDVKNKWGQTPGDLASGKEITRLLQQQQQQEQQGGNGSQELDESDAETPKSRKENDDDEEDDEDEKDELLQWLEQLGLGSYYAKFCEDGFDSIAMIAETMEDSDLERYGMKLAYRRKLLKATKNINQIQPTNSTSSQQSNNSFDTLNEWDASAACGDLQDGQEVTMEGFSGASKHKRNPRKFVIQRRHNIYECSCPEWKMAREPKNRRTCVHLKKYRGELAELRRIDHMRKREYDMAAIHREITSKVKQEKDNDHDDDEEEEEEEEDNVQTPSLSRSVSCESEMGGSSSTGIPQHQVLSYDEFTFGQVIGAGSFGVVHAAEWRGMLVAVKELRIDGKLLLRQNQVIGNRGENNKLAPDDLPDAPPSPILRQESLQEILDLKHEAEMMARVSHHENIIPLIGVLLTPSPCVVTKLMRRGSMEDLLVSKDRAGYMRDRVSYEQLLNMTIDAAAGVLHLHSEGVIHRDLATRNLLVDENFRVKVADFGFSRIKDINRGAGYTSNSVGPIKWMAPESMRKMQYSEQSDVFSFGVTLYEIFLGLKPWENVQPMDVVFRVCQGERIQVPDGSVDPRIKQLMTECQSHEAFQRPNMKQVHETLFGMREHQDEFDGFTPRRIQKTESSSSNEPRYKNFNNGGGETSLFDEKDNYDEFDGDQQPTKTNYQEFDELGGNYHKFQEHGSDNYHKFHGDTYHKFQDGNDDQDDIHGNYEEFAGKNYEEFSQDNYESFREEGQNEDEYGRFQFSTNSTVTLSSSSTNSTQHTYMSSLNEN